MLLKKLLSKQFAETMKFAFFSSEFFWGGLLMLIGLSMIVKTIFGVDIPVFRILVATFLLYWGISIIVNVNEDTKKHTIAFDQETVFPEQIENCYKIRFGKGIIDLQHLKATNVVDKHQRVAVDVLCGDAVIKLPENAAVKVTICTNFGNVSLPDGTTISSGTYTYNSIPANPSTTGDAEKKIQLEVRAEVIFGKLEVITKKTPLLA